jgi:integrase
MGLGRVLDVDLADARDRAKQQRRLLLDGIDPIEHRKAQRAAQEAAARRALSFDEAARAFIHTKNAEWRSRKHAGEWIRTLARDISPVIGEFPVNTIDTALVVKALRPVWERAPESASRLRGRIEMILDWAAVAGHRTPGDNPARWSGHLEHVFPTPRKVKRSEHLAAMSWCDVPTFLTRLRAVSSTAALAFEFLILCAARRGEVLGARWDEIDFDGALWTVPPGRMKAGKEHCVPLSPRCIEILQQQQRVRNGDLIFPGRDGALNESTFKYIMRRFGVSQYTAHGFRSAFRDWCGEATSFPREVAEAALAHSVGDRSEQAYRRGSAVAKRRKLMEAWANFCDKPVPVGATVTQLHGTTGARP